MMVCDWQVDPSVQHGWYPCANGVKNLKAIDLTQLRVLDPSAFRRASLAARAGFPIRQPTETRAFQQTGEGVCVDYCFPLLQILATLYPPPAKTSYFGAI